MSQDNVSSARRTRLPNLSELGYVHRRLVFLTVGMLMLAGIVAYFRLPAREDPAITIREAVILTRFPGMSASRVEALITRTVEEAARELDRVEEIRSVSYDGVSIVHVELAWEANTDLDPEWTELRERIQAITSELPEGTQPPIVNDDFGDVAVVTAALSGADYPPWQLRDEAQAIADALYAVPGTKRVEVFGLPREVVVLEFDGARLDSSDVSLDAVQRSLAGHNVLTTVGDLDLAHRSFYVEADGNLDDLDALRSVLVRSAHGTAVPLGELATVRRDRQVPLEIAAYAQGRPAVVFAVTMQDGRRVLEYAPRVREQIERLDAGLPTGVDLSILSYQAEPVERAVFGVSRSVLETLAIVLVVVVLFLGLRTGLIVGSIVPAVILVTLAVMGATGMDLQRMSLATLVISLGLLVDNGIVIAEDFQLRVREGATRLEALRGSGRELAFPLLASSATTVLFFLPLMLAQDATGEYTRSISLVILISLSVSWLLALLLTPTLCALFGPRADAGAGEPSRTERAFDRLAQLYAAGLRTLLRHRLAFGVFILALLGLSVVLMGIVPKQFFPESDRTEVLVYLTLPNDTSVEQTNRTTQAILEALAEGDTLEHVESHVAYVGFGGPRFVLSLTPTDPAPNTGFMVLEVDARENMAVTVERVRAVLDDRFPLVHGEVTTMFLGPSDSRILEVEVRGPDDETLLGAAEDIVALLNGVPGTRDVHHDWQGPRNRFVLDVDAAQAFRAGVSHGAVAQAAREHLEDRPLSMLRQGDDLIPIVARRAGRDSTFQLLGATVPNGREGPPVPLAQVAGLRVDSGPSRIERRDLQRTLTVYATNASLSAEGLAPLVEADLLALQSRLPDGYTVEIAGVVGESADGQAALAVNMPLCLALLLGLLVAQFNSLRRAALIVLTIPLVVVGAAVGLFVTGNSFGFMVILGLYALAGIIVNNAIVLIDRIDIERRGGSTLRQAVVEASARRLRPILMTTITTIVGLLPLIIGKDVLFAGMATAIAGGLLFGTLFSLGVVPVLYTAFFREPDASGAAV